MNVQSIKDSADKIWKLLHGENRKWEYQEIKEACKLSDRELNAAMGWLASEGKIQFESTRIGDQEILYVESARTPASFGTCSANKNAGNTTS